MVKKLALSLALLTASPALAGTVYDLYGTGDTVKTSGEYRFRNKCTVGGDQAPVGTLDVLGNGIVVTTSGGAQYRARSTSPSDRELRFEMFTDGNAYFGVQALTGAGAITGHLNLRTSADSGASNAGEVRLSPGNTQALVATTGQRIGITQSTPQARLHVTDATIGNEVFRAESVATNDDPNFRLFFSRATAAASSATNIDFSLTTAAPTLAPCPASSVCSVEAEVICHCTSGSSCTANDGAGTRLLMYVKNNGGTISKVGSVLTLAANQISGSSITSITMDTNSTNARVTVTVPANFNHTCHVGWTVKNVGS